MQTKYDRLTLRDQLRVAGCSKQSALGLSNSIVGIKGELTTMMTDIQINLLAEFRRDNKLRLDEQRRESDKLAGDIDRRMKKDTFSIITSIVIAGVAIGASIGLAIYLK